MEAQGKKKKKQQREVSGSSISWSRRSPSAMSVIAIKQKSQSLSGRFEA